ncbi:hypothetical protein XH80_02970 [Bradyrhizobium sp. CCBAU 45384]|nr:hypothetical protein [Bradyrhizobium sp. CCBAU 45384]
MAIHGMSGLRARCARSDSCSMAKRSCSASMASLISMRCTPASMTMRCSSALSIFSPKALDSFVDRPASRIEIVGRPAKSPRCEVKAAIDAAEGRPFPMGSVERFAFYELAKKSYCVIQTGERRIYGCFIFKKGVIPPDA